MSSSVLAYSPDHSVLDKINAWAQHGGLENLHAFNSFEIFSQHFTENDYDAVILDCDGIEPPLTALIQRMAGRQTGAKLLLLQRPGCEIEDDLSSAIEISTVSQPFDDEKLYTAFNELIAVDRRPEIAQSESLDPAVETVEEDDLSYLKGWIPEDPLPEDVEEITIEQEEILSTEVKDLDNEIDGSPETAADETNPPALPDNEENAIEPRSEESISIQMQQTGIDSEVQNNPPVSITPSDGPSDTPEPGVEQPVDPAVSQDNSDSLIYSCVLVPANPQHFLTRQLAERISISLPWIHISRGWRLTGLSVRPQYMQWSMELPPDVSPASAMKEIRQLSSDQLFASFSELKEGEQEQDFWAPGDLVVSGSQPVSFSMIKALIDRTKDPQPEKNRS